MCGQKINDAMSKTLLAGENFEDFETHFYIKWDVQHWVFGSVF
jgi:hypothetical protein